jgi:O-antigen/teichoic acid export membrane protein
MPELGIQRLGEATRWRYAYLVSQGGLSAALYVALAHILPSSAFPACATALGVIVIAQAAADFGLSQAAVAVLPNPSSLGRVYARADLEAGAALTFLFAAIGAILLCSVAAAVVPGSATTAVISVAPAASIAVAVAGTDGILRAEGEFRRPVIIVAVSRLGALAGLPAAASKSATVACLGVSAGTMAFSLPALALLIQRLRNGRPRHTAGPFLGAAAPLGISNVAVVASARLNTLILSGVASLRSAAVFEGAWRLFQIGQYAIGAVPSAAAPFIARALADRDRSELRHALRRAAVLITLGGGLYAALLILARGAVDHALFGTLGPPIGRSLLWLAPAVPLNLLAFLMLFTLAAASAIERRWVATAYFVGATFNVAVLLTIAHSDPYVAGAAAAAAGITATTLVLSFRFRTLLRTLERQDNRTAPLPSTEW